MLNETPSYKSRLCVEELQRSFGFNIGAEIHGKNDYMLFACLQNDLEVIKIFIEAGADVNARDAHLMTPLFFANTAETARFLLEHGADVNARDDQGRTPLIYHASSERPESYHLDPDEPVAIAKVLLEYGADVHATQNDGTSALSWYVHEDMLRLLLEHGADATLITDEGWSPLHRCYNAATAELLIAHGADPNGRGRCCEANLGYNRKNNTQTPIFKCKTPDVAEALIKHGADINARDAEGRVPLCHVESAIAMVLLKHNADVNPPMPEDKEAHWSYAPPLHNPEQDPIVISEMLHRGADPNGRQTNTEYTLLHVCRSAKVAQILLEHGADVNARDRFGQTPLHRCCDGFYGWDEQVAIAKVLLKHGADIHAKDVDGRTPVYYCKADNTALLGLLKAHGADPWKSYDDIPLENGFFSKTIYAFRKLFHVPKRATSKGRKANNTISWRNMPGGQTGPTLQIGIAELVEAASCENAEADVSGNAEADVSGNDDAQT